MSLRARETAALRGKGWHFSCGGKQGLPLLSPDLQAKASTGKLTRSLWRNQGVSVKGGPGAVGMGNAQPSAEDTRLSVSQR